MTSLPYLTQKIQIQGINWKATVFWGIILGVAAFVIYQYREPVMAYLAKPTFDLSWMQNLTLDNILSFLKTYGVLISCGAAAFTFIYGVYQKHQANKAALDLLKTQQVASSELSTAYATAEQYKQQAESYKSKYEQGTQYDDALSTAKAKVSKLEQQNKDLQTRYSEASQLVNVIQNPTETVMKRKLEEAGYLVTKKVS